MRIISGEFRGRKLATPRGVKIRPTADRLRESIFNILGPAVAHTTVLDLFAGTGALGLEALSRGARSAVFVDIGGKALDLVGKNIVALDLSDRTHVLRWDIRRNLACLGHWTQGFNLIFMDPPYGRNLVIPTLAHLRSSEALAANAHLVVEHSSDEHVDPTRVGFRLVDQRLYGDTIVSFLNDAV